MIMSWLLNSMLPEIGKPFFYLSSAKEEWDAILETHSGKGNAAWIDEFKTIIHNTQQKDLTVTTNYNTLKSCGKNWIFINTLAWNLQQKHQCWPNSWSEIMSLTFLLDLNLNLTR